MHVKLNIGSKLYLLKVFSILALIGLVLIPPIVPQETTKNVVLPHFDIAMTFPLEGDPGESIIVSMTTVTTDSARVKELTIFIYAYTGSGEQRTIVEDVIVKDLRVKKDDTFQKSYTIMLPSDIPRSPLQTVIFEVTSSSSYSYSRYGYWPYSYYWTPANSPYSWSWGSYYAVPYSYSSSREQVACVSIPLTYVKTITPEYEALQLDYDSLSKQYDDLQVKNEDLKNEQEKLEASHQTVLAERDNLNAELITTKAQLAETKTLMYLFIATTIIFAITTLLVALLTRRVRYVEVPPSTTRKKK